MKQNNPAFQFVNIPRNKWPKLRQDTQVRDRVFLSREFLVQVFDEAPYVRLSINRTRFDNGDWAAGISWDELMQIKIALGYDEKDAVEVYPPIKDVVYVANIRHLWILPEPLPFAWRAAEDHTQLEDKQHQNKALSSE